MATTKPSQVGSITYPNFADIDRKRKENKENFEKNVPENLSSEYLYFKEQLKQIEPRKQAELNVIRKRFDATKQELRLKAKNSLEKMSELTGISTTNLTSMVGGYYIND